MIDAVEPVHDLARGIARDVGAAGPCITVSTACSSSTGAIGLARDMIAMGGADAILAGGTDVLSSSVFAGFHALGILSAEKCAPYSLPFGTTLGEGAGFLVLERGEAAHARGAKVLARISGFGLSGDGYHETSPDPEGGGVTRALRAALADSDLQPEDIGYINAHGTGTEANDPSEWRGIQRGLGNVTNVPVSSTKGALGHTQGAAGVLESIVTILTMRRDLVAPTLNFVGARKFAPSDPVGGSSPRRAVYKHALCLNSAFGGSNAALVLSRPDRSARKPRPRVPLDVLGVGLVGPYGLGTHAFEKACKPDAPGRVSPFEIKEVVPRTDPRGLDPSSRFLIAAVALCLQDARVRLRGSLRDRTGLIAGAIRPSPESVRAFGDSVSERGLRSLSAAAFARIVLNAPAGFCSKALTLRGPHTAIATGAGSGLAAVVSAAEVLSTRDDVSLMLGAAVDELALDSKEIEQMAEGAVSVLLARPEFSTSREDTPRVRMTGWGMAGPRDLGRAVQMASSGEDGTDAPFDSVFDEREYCQYLADSYREWAAPSAMAFADAVLVLRRGEARRVLVTSDLVGSVSIAAVLRA